MFIYVVKIEQEVPQIDLFFVENSVEAEDEGMRFQCYLHRVNGRIKRDYPRFTQKSFPDSRH